MNLFFKIMKKFSFYVLIAIIIFIFANLLSVITIYIVTEKNYFNKNDYVSFKKRFRKTDEKTTYPHPFFGFTHTYLKPAENKISLEEQLYSYIPSNVEDEDIKILHHTLLEGEKIFFELKKLSEKQPAKNTDNQMDMPQNL